MDLAHDRAPKVSVCVVTYNQKHYIAQCLQSILDQETDFDFEIVVGEDCSTDGTREIVADFCRRYPHKFRPLFHAQNVGAYENFLRVHDFAAGNYVVHIDGDDYALPGKLQAQAGVLDSDPACTAVWHRVDFFDDDGGFCSGESADLSSFAEGCVTFSDAIRLGFVGVHSSLMYRRSSRTRISLDRQALDLYFTWDLLSKGHGYIIKNILGRYRVSAAGSITTNSQRTIRLLSISHAEEFLSRFPRHRRDFAVWALSNFAIDAKNRRRTAWDLLKLVWRIRSPISPSEIISNLQRMRDTQVRWRAQRENRSETI